jgi:7-cyano-7-deazaguanine synthase
MDSTTMLYEYKDEIALAVTFDYGANHGPREIPLARMHCQRLGIEHLVISMDFMYRYFQSSLLSGAEAIPEGSYDDQNMRSTVVPFRNGIMLAIACGLAESRGLKRLMLANHAGDHAIYPDCRPAFVEAMSQATQAGTYDGITIFAPYTQLTKGQIAAHGKRLGLDYSETWSCYKGGEKHCGRCGTCVERREALAEAGIEDTTEYEALDS